MIIKNNVNEEKRYSLMSFELTNNVQNLEINNNISENNENDEKPLSFYEKILEYNPNFKDNKYIKKQFLMKKREKNPHTKYSTDNIFRRINVHFLNSIIIFLNEVLSKLDIIGEFKIINYKFKKYLNKTKFNKIKKESFNFFFFFNS